MSYSVGQKLFIKYFGSWSWFYTPVVVSNITPAGLVDVKFGYTLEGNDNEPMRFRVDGHIQKKKGSFVSDYEIDTMPYEERIAERASEERAKVAAKLVSEVVPEGRVRAEWGKDGLLAEVIRIQTRLDAAKKAVEAI